MIILLLGLTSACPMTCSPGLCPRPIGAHLYPSSMIPAQTLLWCLCFCTIAHIAVVQPARAAVVQLQYVHINMFIYLHLCMQAKYNTMRRWACCLGPSDPFPLEAQERADQQLLPRLAYPLLLSCGSFPCDCAPCLSKPVLVSSLHDAPVGQG